MSTVLYTGQRTNGSSPCGCSYRCKRRAFAPPVGSVVLSCPLCTHKDAHTDQGLSEAVYLVVDQSLLRLSLASQKMEASLY